MGFIFNYWFSTIRHPINFADETIDMIYIMLCWGISSILIVFTRVEFISRVASSWMITNRTGAICELQTITPATGLCISHTTSQFIILDTPHQAILQTTRHLQIKYTSLIPIQIRATLIDSPHRQFNQIKPFLFKNQENEVYHAVMRQTLDIASYKPYQA